MEKLDRPLIWRRLKPDALCLMPDSDNKSLWVQLARYSELAFILPAATVAGWLIGLALDHWLHTTWLYIVGLIVGIVAGFVQLIRTVISGESKT
jgi:F0F1-type ATP synthase assembly protein I